ncbi:MAG: hypothetical protein ACN4A7_03450 [Thermacetogeniaceae bacterium]|jgi:hypothetical protein|nr:hypothetical protein [Syntrophomonadaceae bacterium]HAF16929.1 hypothetical protein [Peptococcaceae bacterium]
MTLCPVCNGLTNLVKDCPACGSSMEDCGKMSTFTDPYGPYEETAGLESNSTVTGDSHCVHFLHCPNCDENTSYIVNSDEI